MYCASRKSREVIKNNGLTLRREVAKAGNEQACCFLYVLSALM